MEMTMVLPQLLPLSSDSFEETLKTILIRVTHKSMIFTGSMVSVLKIMVEDNIMQHK